MLTGKSKPDFGFLPLRPRTLISLRDMTQFFQHDFLIVWIRFEAELKKFESAGVSPGAASQVEPQIIRQIISLLSLLKIHCQKIGLHHSFGRASTLCERAESGICTHQIMMVGLDELHTCILGELGNKNFVFIPDDKAIYFEQDGLFGEAVFNTFEAARQDIKDAGNCIAAGLNTAAVFHLMRVVEFGLRKLAADLKAKKLIKKLKPSKIPVELGTWEEVIVTLEVKLDELRMQARSVKRDQKISVRNELLKEFRSVKDLWRNSVMHARATYDAEQALSAFNHVRGFMQKLAGKI